MIDVKFYKLSFIVAAVFFLPGWYQVTAFLMTVFGFQENRNALQLELAKMTVYDNAGGADKNQQSEEDI